jgi:D-tyrosyl-tRNA(Tyr) deacylase
MKIALHTLLTEKQRVGLHDWSCGLEATHHGPLIEGPPVLFIEIGSSKQEWQNTEAAEIVARSIVTVAEKYTTSYPTVLGFGGPHYCPAFTRLCAETNFAISHVVPRYHLNQVSESLIRQAIKRTAAPVSLAALDWKGMKSSERNQILELLKNVGLEATRVRDLLRIPT